MNVFKTDVEIDEILMKILNIIKQNLLMILWSLLIVVCDVNIISSLILSLLSLLFLLSLLMLLLWLLMSILLTLLLTIFKSVTSLSLMTNIWVNTHHQICLMLHVIYIHTVSFWNLKHLLFHILCESSQLTHFLMLNSKFLKRQFLNV